MTDIGTGTYTILAQIAAETLGVPVGQVTVEIGDTDLSRHAGLRRLVRRGQLPARRADAA